MKIDFNADEISFIDAAAEKIAIMKLGEKQYEIDNGNVKKRFKTGLIGEAAVYKMLGYSCYDIEFDAGCTKKFSHCDIENIGFFKTGIKSVEEGKAHIIYRNNKENQILLNVCGNSVEILGIATVDVLNDPNNHDDNLILDKRILYKGFKTAFIGYDKLIPFNEENLISLE